MRREASLHGAGQTEGALPLTRRALLTSGASDHVITIAKGLAALSAEKIASTSLYNGTFPGPVLRFQEGRKVTIDVHNSTDHTEVLHWHGQEPGGAGDLRPLSVARAFSQVGVGTRCVRNCTLAGC